MLDRMRTAANRAHPRFREPGPLDVVDFARYIAALLLVLGLLGALAVLLRRGYGRSLLPGALGRTERRMRVVETLALDPRRRVMIVQVDDAEHVLLLGAGSDVKLDTRPSRREAAPVFTPVPPDDAAREAHSA